MKAEDVTQCAQLLDQLAKLEGFLLAAPANANTLTITLRRGKNGKSLSLNDQITTKGLRQVVENIRDETRQRILDMGVEIDE